MANDNYDEQVKEGFAKLQQQVYESKQRIAIDDEIRDFKEKQKESRKIILERVNEHPDDAGIYRTIGRAHFCTTKEDEIKRQQQFIDDHGNDLKKIAERKEIIYKKLDEAQNNLRELLAQRKS